MPEARQPGSCLFAGERAIEKGSQTTDGWTNGTGRRFADRDASRGWLSGGQTWHKLRARMQFDGLGFKLRQSRRDERKELRLLPPLQPSSLTWPSLTSQAFEGARLHLPTLGACVSSHSSSSSRDEAGAGRRRPSPRVGPARRLGLCCGNSLARSQVCPPRRRAQNELLVCLGKRAGGRAGDGARFSCVRLS